MGKTRATNVNTNSNRLTVNVVVNTGRRTAKKDSADAGARAEGTTKPTNVNVYAPAASPRIPDSWAAYVRQKRAEANTVLPAIVPGGIPNLPRQASPPQFQTNPLFESSPSMSDFTPFPEQHTPFTEPRREAEETPYFTPTPEYFKEFKAAEAAAMSPEAPSATMSPSLVSPSASAPGTSSSPKAPEGSPQPRREMTEGDYEMRRLTMLHLSPAYDRESGKLRIRNPESGKMVLVSGKIGQRVIREAEVMAAKETGM